jgi:hypothetical protein
MVVRAVVLRNNLHVSEKSLWRVRPAPAPAPAGQQQSAEMLFVERRRRASSSARQTDCATHANDPLECAPLSPLLLVDRSQSCCASVRVLPDGRKSLSRNANTNHFVVPNWFPSRSSFLRRDDNDKCDAQPSETRPRKTIYND